MYFFALGGIEDQAEKGGKIRVTIPMLLLSLFLQSYVCRLAIGLVVVGLRGIVLLFSFQVTRYRAFFTALIPYRSLIVPRLTRNRDERGGGSANKSRFVICEMFTKRRR